MTEIDACKNVPPTQTFEMMLRYAPLAMQSLIGRRKKLSSALLAYEAFELAKAMANEELARWYVRGDATCQDSRVAD